MFFNLCAQMCECVRVCSCECVLEREGGKRASENELIRIYLYLHSPAEASEAVNKVGGYCEKLFFDFPLRGIKSWGQLSNFRCLPSF